MLGYFFVPLQQFKNIPTMKRLLTMVATALLIMPCNIQAQQNEEVKIGKQNIRLQSKLMTPEALWAMGRIGSCEASPDGRLIVYQVGYYSVKANKSQQKIAIVNADGTGNTTLTIGSKSESEPTWIDNETIAFMTGGEVWKMKADGSRRLKYKECCGRNE